MAARAPEPIPGDLGLLTLARPRALPGQVPRRRSWAPTAGARSWPCRRPPRAGSPCSRCSTCSRATTSRPSGPSSADALHRDRREPEARLRRPRRRTWPTPTSCAVPDRALISKSLRRAAGARDRPRAGEDLRGRRWASPARPGGRRTANPAGTTTHVSVIDAEGNAVALTCTIEQEFGSAVVAPRHRLPAQQRDDRLLGPGHGQRAPRRQAPALVDGPRSSCSDGRPERRDRRRRRRADHHGLAVLGVAVRRLRPQPGAGGRRRAHRRRTGRAAPSSPRAPASPPAVWPTSPRRGHRLTNLGEYDIRPRIQIAGIDLDTGRRVGQSDPRSDFATLAARRPPAATGRPRADRRVPTVALARAVGDGEVTLSWTGRDRGTGIASYTVQVRAPGADGYTTVAARTARVRLAVPARRAGRTPSGCAPPTAAAT